MSKRDVIILVKNGEPEVQFIGDEVNLLVHIPENCPVYTLDDKEVVQIISFNHEGTANVRVIEDESSDSQVGRIIRGVELKRLEWLEDDLDNDHDYLDSEEEVE